MLEHRLLRWRVQRRSHPLKEMVALEPATSYGSVVDNGAECE